MLEGAREQGLIDLDPENKTVPFYNDSTTVKCFMKEHKKYKCYPHGIGFTVKPNTNSADYHKQVEPQGAVLVNHALLYFLDYVNRFKIQLSKTTTSSLEDYLEPEKLHRGEQAKWYTCTLDFITLNLTSNLSHCYSLDGCSFFGVLSFPISGKSQTRWGSQFQFQKQKTEEKVTSSNQKR